MALITGGLSSIRYLKVKGRKNQTESRNDECRYNLANLFTFESSNPVPRSQYDIRKYPGSFSGPDRGKVCCNTLGVHTDCVVSLERYPTHYYAFASECGPAVAMTSPRGIEHVRRCRINSLELTPERLSLSPAATKRRKLLITLVALCSVKSPGHPASSTIVFQQSTSLTTGTI